MTPLRCDRGIGGPRGVAPDRPAPARQAGWGGSGGEPGRFHAAFDSRPNRRSLAERVKSAVRGIPQLVPAGEVVTTGAKGANVRHAELSRSSSAWSRGAAAGGPPRATHAAAAQATP